MLKLYNKEHVAVAALTNLKDYKIEYLLSGEDELEFSLSICDENITLVEEEGYVRNKYNEYVIKAVDPSQNFKRFTCIVNVESIKAKAIKNFDTSNNTIDEAIRLAIAGTGWILVDTGITKRRTVRLKNTDALGVLRDIRKIFRVDFRFDAINKKIFVYEQLGNDKGVYFSDELNLKSLQIPSDTYDYVTRLYCYGKEGLNISAINGGKEYVENFQYSNKVIEKIWADDRYTVVESLKEDALAKLEELSKPKRSYQASIVDLAKMSNEYEFLDFFLGDTIILLSKTEKFRDKQRIVKYIEYPKDPSKNTCELGNTTLTFEEIQKENEFKNKIVDNITTDNGTVDGSTINSIKTEQISDFETSVAKITDLTVVNAKIENLEAFNVSITGRLTAVEADIGALNANIGVIDKLTVTHTAQINNLIATKADITDLNAVNATIQVLEAHASKIDTLLNGNLSSENIQAGGITSDKLSISNGFITNAMISNLDVSKVNAGDISTNKFRITSASGNMLISDNTIQIRDTNRVRVQIGKDASNDYSMYVWDSNGNLMFDATGLKANGIKDKIIRDDMISDNANIDGHKLNINSVVTQINNGSTTIKSSKVQIDGLNQTLDVAFNSLKTQVNETKTTTESNSTTIGVMQGQISTAINNTQIVKDGQTILLKDDYNRTVATVDSMKSTIGSHTTQINNATGKINNVETKVNTVERDLNSITARVSSTETNITTIREAANNANTKIDNLKIGVRNILKNGGIPVTSSTYVIQTYSTHVPLRKGNTYTIVFKGSIAEGQRFGLWYNDGYNRIDILDRKDGSAVYTLSFTISQDLTHDYLSFYNYPSTTGKSATIEWACLYEGNVKPPLDYVKPIEDIQVGGRNLLRDSLSIKLSNSDYAPNVDISTPGKLIVKNGSARANGYVWLQGNFTESINEKLEYCFSVDVKTNYTPRPDKAFLEFDFRNANGVIKTVWAEIPNTQGKWVRINAVMPSLNTAVTKALWCFTINENSGLTTLEYRNPKLEQSNKGSDWTPAPEDVQTEITTTKNKISVIETNLSSITSRVSSVETTNANINGQVSNLSTRMNAAEQKITDSSIISIVSKQFYSKGEADTRYASQTQISQLDNKITSKVETIENWKQSDTNRVINSKIYQSSNAYGFGYRDVMFERGKQYSFTVNGRVSQQALNDGKKLAVFIYNDDWTWSKVLYIDSLENTNAYITFTAPDNGLHRIQSYLYPNGGSRAGEVTANWYKCVEGNRPSIAWSPAPEDINGRVDQQQSEIVQLSSQISSKVDVNGVISIIQQNSNAVNIAFNNINPNVQHTPGMFSIKNGKFEMFDYSNTKIMYVDEKGLISSLKGFATYKPDQSGMHFLGNIIYHVPNKSDNYDNMYIESNKPILFKTALSWDGQQGKSYQQIATSGVQLNGYAWDPSGVQGYILATDFELDKVCLYNQHKSMTMSLVARNGYFDSITVTGAKNRIVETEKFGTRRLNAVESAECYFEDRGRDKIKNGKCIIAIDPIFAETVDINDYDIHISKYGKGDLWISERNKTYFVVEGDNDIEFSYILYAKQKGYENHRLEIYKETKMSEVDKILIKNNLNLDMLKDKNEFWKIYEK